MKKSICLMLIAFLTITSCAGQKDTASRLEKKSKQKVLPYKINIESNILADSIRAHIEPQLREKGFKVLDTKEYTKLADQHYNTMMRRIDSKTKPEDIPKLMDSGEEFVRILLIRCNLQQGGGDQLEFKNLSYKIFTVSSSKKPEFIIFDLTRLPNPSLRMVCDELVTILVEATGK